MKDILHFLTNFIARLTSRSFMVTVVVLFIIATRSELSIEAIIGLLVGAGLVNARAIAEDQAGGDTIVITDPQTPEEE